MDNKKNTMIGKNKLLPRILMSVLCMALVVIATFSVAFALNDVTAEQLLGGIINIVLEIVKYAGVIIFIVGVILMVFAMRQEDSDSKTRAGLFIVIGIICFTLGSLLAPILNLFGITLV